MKPTLRDRIRNREPFVLRGAPYDFGTDAQCAALARIARKDRPGFDRFVQRGFVRIKKIKGDQFDTECFVCESRWDANVYVVFRGTEVGEDLSLTDIITDLKFHKTTLETGHVVHAGFGRAWEEVRDEVLAEISSRKAKRGLNVVVTGHSLGGALACLAAAELGDCFPELVTFGQPRVAGSDFVHHLEAVCVDYRRWVHRRDVITMVPFSFGYVHGGNLMYIGESDIIKQASKQLRMQENATRLTRRFTDHRMKNYEQRVIRAFTKGIPVWVEA